MPFISVSFCNGPIDPIMLCREYKNLLTPPIFNQNENLLFLLRSKLTLGMLAHWPSSSMSMMRMGYPNPHQIYYTRGQDQSAPKLHSHLIIYWCLVYHWARLKMECMIYFQLIKSHTSRRQHCFSWYDAPQILGHYFHSWSLIWACWTKLSENRHIGAALFLFFKA